MSPIFPMSPLSPMSPIPPMSSISPTSPMSQIPPNVPNVSISPRHPIPQCSQCLRYSLCPHCPQCPKCPHPPDVPNVPNVRNVPQLLCSLVAGLLHFLFLSCFSWMFLEGLHLLLRVRNLRALTSGRGRALGGRLLLPVAYGVPAAVVAVSAAVRPQGYGTERHCWLNVERGFLWSFLGPVCTVVAVNLGFFLTTLWTLRAQLSTLNADVTTLKNMRLVTLKALAHLLILGCTWALGLLQGRGLLGAFLFTIVNSLQGAFIFLVHCLLNPQVRELYCRWLRALRCRGHAQATPTTDGQMTSVTTVTTVSSTMDSERPQPHSSEGCSWQK